MRLETRNNSIKLNFIMNAILTVSSFIFPLITFPYVSRVLLPAGTGRVSFATSLILYFDMIAQLGIPMYGIRACAKVRDDRDKLTTTVQELLIINIVMDVIAYVLFAMALLLIPRLFEDRLLYVIISSSIFLNTIGMEWLYKALEQYTYITIRSIVFKFVGLIAMFILVRNPSDYIFYGFITIFATSASNIYNFISAFRIVDFKFNNKKYDFKRHLKPIFAFFAMACATTIYVNLDTVMLGFMKSDMDVGYYNAAVRIKMILVSIVTSLGAVLLPRASYYVEKGMLDEFKRISIKAINFVVVLSTGMMVYFIVFARNGIFFLAGNAYERAIIPMQILMPTLVLIGLTNILGIQMLVPLGKEVAVLHSEMAGAIVDLILNAILIPRMASSGAAIGTLAAEIVVLIVQLRYLRDEIRNVNIPLGKVLISVAVSTMASIWILWLGLGNFLTLVGSAIIFFGTYGLILYLLKDETIEMIIGFAWKQLDLLFGVEKLIQKFKVWFFNLNGEDIFLFAFALIVVGESLGTTMFSIPRIIVLIFRYVPLLILVLKMVIFDRYKKLEFVVYATFMGVALLSMLAGGSKQPLIWMITIIGAKDVDFEKILKVWLFCSVVVVGVAMFGSQIGTVINLQYTKDYSNVDYVDVGANLYSGVRNAFGIIFPTDFAAHIFNILLVSFYLLRKRMSIVYVLIGFVCSLLVFKYTHARLDTYCMYILCAGYSIYCITNSFRTKISDKYRIKKKHNVIFCFSMPIGAIVMTWLSYNFDYENDFFVSLNKLLSSRLQLGKSMFKNYGLSLFGKDVELIGAGTSTKGHKGYNFVDCSYLYNALLYGIIFILIVILISVLVCFKKRYDGMYLFSIILISLNAMVAHHLTDIAYTVFLFAWLCRDDIEEVKNDLLCERRSEF